MKKTVLIVTDHMPGHDAGFQKSGHGHYLQTFIDHFCAREFDVRLCVVRPKVDFIRISVRDLPYTVDGPAFEVVRDRLVLRDPKDIVLCAMWHVFSRLPQKLQNIAASIRLRFRELKGYSHDLGHPLSEAERSFVHAIADKHHPDIVVYDGIFNACGKLCDAQHWIITHEVKHQRARSFADRGVSVTPAEFDIQTEREILENVGNVIAIQWDDAAEFRQLAPLARVVVVPVAMDIVPTNEARLPISGRMLFVGSGSFHNYDGIRWFLERCWGEIRQAFPEATLDIIGTVCFRLGAVPAGVTLCGVVDDLEAAYRLATLAIVPLQIGSGLKVKIVEALAHGVPVVTTALGAQGLAGFDPQPFIICDDATDFARRCVEVLKSVEQQGVLARAAGACAKRFTTDNAFQEFTDATRFESLV